MNNTAIIIIDGLQYEGWLNVAVTRSLGEAAASFRLSVTEQTGAGLPFAQFPAVREGSACTVVLSGQLAITGYVDIYNPSYSATEHGVEISGRSKTADLVDSSADIKGGQFRKTRMDAILKALTKEFDVDVILKAPAGEPLLDFSINPGETVFALTDRLARLRGALVHDNEKGELVIERVEPQSPVGSLVEGVNILSASATFRADQRFSDYKVKGQRTGTDENFAKNSSEKKAAVKDTWVKRYRPLLVIAEEPGDDVDMRNRADWEATKRAGEAIEASIVTTGWTRTDGKLWAPGDLIDVESEMLALKKQLVAETVTYRQSSDQGTVTEIRLVPAEAVNPKPAKKANKKSTVTAATPGDNGRAASDAWNQSKPTEQAK